jgi:threonine dehydratase
MESNPTSPLPTVQPPSLDEIRAAREAIAEHVHRTPSVSWANDRLREALGTSTRVHLKLELWQRTGTFKARGALCALMALDEAQRGAGVVAASAGNHALAVAYAAGVHGVDAKVFMPENADEARVAGCRALGAEVELVASIHEAFARCEAIERDEGRAFIHPFDGPAIALGTATLGLEIVEQVPEVEAVVVPIGGGGLCAGVASAVRQLRPDCLVIGVEPTGADTMRRSFAAGAPASIDAVRTIADSLGAPRAMPYSFGLCREFVQHLVQLDDADLIDAMRLLGRDLKLVAEPACAATTAAALGPAADLLRGRQVVLIACGSNIAPRRWAELVEG